MPQEELNIIYRFDYKHFSTSHLESKAKDTLYSLLSFVRQTFDGLLETGKALQDFYQECLVSSPIKGKKVFDQWLASPDFGVSRYIAKSAMEIYGWFEKLHPKMQRLVRQNVQQWSVSSLRKLTKLSIDLVKELVTSGKKTAAQIQLFVQNTIATATQNQSHQESNKMPQTPSESNFQTPESHTPPINEPKLAPGVRIVVVGDTDGWNGHKGIIVSEYDKKFWVLLDHTIAQGMEVKHLFKPEQLAIEKKNRKPEKLFTKAELEQEIAQAIAGWEKEKAEKEIARYVEINEAALASASAEIKAVETRIKSLEQEKQELLKELDEAQGELVEAQSLQEKNEQLKQRAAELEKALEDSKNNAWSDTFNNQAAKVINTNLEQTIAPLSLEVERLQKLTQKQEDKLTELQITNRNQQEEIAKYQQSGLSVGVEKIIAEFGVWAERLGLNGWNRFGYRAADGMLRKGISAIEGFICDLEQNVNSHFDVAFTN